MTRCSLRSGGSGGETNPDEDQTDPAQRRADAVGLLAERALAAGFGIAHDESENEAPINGSRAERYQVVLHVEESTLSEAAEPGMSELEDGTRVSAEPSAHMHAGAQRPDWVTRETIERSEMKLPGG